MKTILLTIASFLTLNIAIGQPTNWQNFSATSCNGITQSVKNVIQDSLKPIVLIWEGYDCPFCRDEGQACATSATKYGSTMMYWNAFGRINGNATCAEAESWASEFNVPARNFVFIDKPAEDNWSQPVSGQGRWYWVISRDRITKEPKMVYSGNLINDAEIMGRRAVGDFKTTTSTEVEQSLLSSINIFPNPAADNMTLQMELQATATVSAEILNMVGTSFGKVLNGSFQGVNKNIDLSSLSSGIYVLNVMVDGVPSRHLFTKK